MAILEYYKGPLSERDEAELRNAAVEYAAVASKISPLVVREAMEAEYGWQQSIILRGMKIALEAGLIEQLKGSREYRLTLAGENMYESMLDKQTAS